MKSHVWRAALLYAALTVFFTWPLARRAHDSSLPVSPDTHLFAWTLAWDTHTIVRQPLAIFDANIFYPERRTLAYSENLLGSTIFAAPILWLTGNPVLAMNAVALLSCVLCGLGAYLLALRAGVSRSGALLCGAIFAFSPARLFRIGQLHLTTIQWVPFTLAFLHTYLDERRGRDLRIATAFFTLQMLTSGHGAVFLIVAIAALLVYRFASGEPFDLARHIKDFGIAGALLLVPVALLIIPYRRVQAEMGLERTLDNWTVTPESFIASPTHAHMAIIARVWDGNIWDTASATLFPGYLPIALAIVAVVTVRLKGDTTRATVFYALLTAFAILFCVGPPLGLWPYVHWLPGFNFIRVPSRFMLLAVLGMAVLSGIGFDRLARWLPETRRRVAAVVAGFILAIEFAAIPFTLERFAIRIPAADRWLASQPTPFVVAEMPTDISERLQTTYMLHAMAHWQKTIHGYSGMRPPLHEDLYRQLRRFPDDLTIARLKELGVTYVVVHADMYAADQWPIVERRLGEFADRLKLDYLGADGRVYSVR